MRLLPSTNGNDIANDLKDFFFVSIGLELAKDIHSDINPLNYVSNIKSSIAIVYVSCAEVINVIHSLSNSSAGYDKFPTFVSTTFNISHQFFT